MLPATRTQPAEVNAMADGPVQVDDRGDGTLKIALCGDIDFDNSDDVRERIRAAVEAAEPKTVRVDLANVPFLDSSGVAVLVSAHRLATSIGAEYVVERPTPAVYEHLRLTGVAELFGITGSGTSEPTPPA
jgi:anti-anti-sigma factor